MGTSVGSGSWAERLAEEVRLWELLRAYQAVAQVGDLPELAALFAAEATRLAEVSQALADRLGDLLGRAMVALPAAPGHGRSSNRDLDPVRADGGAVGPLDPSGGAFHWMKDLSIPQ
jgi:hypothetical protein